MFGRDPTAFRIPHLRITHVSFLHGENDWMDAAGGLHVQEQCRAMRQNNGLDAAPAVDVYQVSNNAGHLLVLDYWREFNTVMVLVAGLQPSGLDGALPRKLFPNQTVPGTNEMGKLLRRAPTKPVAATACCSQANDYQLVVDGMHVKSSMVQEKSLGAQHDDLALPGTILLIPSVWCQYPAQLGDDFGHVTK